MTLHLLKAVLTSPEDADSSCRRMLELCKRLKPEQRFRESEEKVLAKSAVAIRGGSYFFCTDTCTDLLF